MTWHLYTIHWDGWRIISRVGRIWFLIDLIRAVWIECVICFQTKVFSGEPFRKTSTTRLKRWFYMEGLRSHLPQVDQPPEISSPWIERRFSDRGYSFSHLRPCHSLSLPYLRTPAHRETPSRNVRLGRRSASRPEKVSESALNSPKTYE